MNNDIKEILDKLQKVANKETASRNALMEMKDKDYQLLLDYITNLQEQLHQASLDTINNLQEENERLALELNENMIERNNYLSRIDKAIEYIEKEYDENIVICDQYDMPITPQDLYDDLTNILKGEDKE